MEVRIVGIRNIRDNKVIAFVFICDDKLLPISGCHKHNYGLVTRGLTCLIYYPSFLILILQYSFPR